MDSRFIKDKDPIRNPLVQKKIEGDFKDSYDKALEVILVRTAKILSKKK